MASAVPLYQCSSMRCCGGRTSMYSLSSRGKKPQPAVMCRSRLRALYCVSTNTRRKLALMQLDRVKSMMRYSPPNGTAGLARSRVSGSSRVPLPPAKINVRTSFTVLASRGSGGDPFGIVKGGRWNGNRKVAISGAAGAARRPPLATCLTHLDNRSIGGRILPIPFSPEVCLAHKSDLLAGGGVRTHNPPGGVSPGHHLRRRLGRLGPRPVLLPLSRRFRRFRLRR